MGVFKLPPPVVAGTTPPFYQTNGTYILRVPFSMNKIVNRSEVGGVKLRIRAADTDLEIGRLTAISYAISTEEGSYANFDLTPIVASIMEGKYYKLQLAYIDSADSTVIGYYSTVSIVKCTSYPTVSIVGLDEFGTNVDTTAYTGLYTNVQDSSEKCYQYKFTLYDSVGEVVETTGWCLHNANTDDSSTESNDFYELNYACSNNEKYRLQYSVITNNNLQVDGTMYMIVGATSVAPELKAYLKADLDYDNGCVHLSFEPWQQTKAEKARTNYAGSFIITRSSSRENFKKWTKIVSLVLTGTLPTGAVFTDFTIEQGQTYRYALQQFNDNKIYSSRIYADDIHAVFEDAFLFDGERQLRIRFNPKVSSFKTVIQDSKKNTLGSKYPFFFRNGNVAYKEFPISGLISYMVDENEYFMSRTKDLGMDVDWQDTTDIIDENIAFERKFKLAVLDWLNDGNIKLFRSPGEGNYLVRLMNVQLTPNDSLSRMIHTFQCQASEIDTFLPSKLIQYGFLKVQEENPMALKFGTINFAEVMRNYCSVIEGSVHPNYKTSTIQQAEETLANSDLLEGHACSYIKFEDCRPQTYFTIDNVNKYMVGATGIYEANFDPAVQVLKIQDPYFDMPGSVTYGVWTTQSSTFDTVNNITQRDVFACPPSGGNYIETVTDTKHRIQTIYAMHFTLNDLVYEISSLEDFSEQYNFYLTHSAVKAYKVIYGLSAQEHTNQITALTYQYEMGYIDEVTYQQQKQELDDLYALTVEWSAANQHIIDNEVTIRGEVREHNNEGRTLPDLFVNNAMFLDLSTGNLYQYNALDQTFDVIEATQTVEIQHYQKSTRSWVSETVTLSPTQICIDNDIIDIAETGYLDVPQTSDIPEQIVWGSKVSALLIYQLLTIGFGVEDQIAPGLGQDVSLVAAWRQYSDAMKYDSANKLKFKRISKNAASFVNNIPAGEYDECAYFVWNDTTLHFDRLSRAMRAKFSESATEVWIPWPYANTSQKEGSWVPTGNVFDGSSALPYKSYSTFTGYTYPTDVEQLKQRYYELLDYELAIQNKKLVLSDE